MIVYRCTDVNCVECGQYDKEEKKGICTACLTGYKLSETKVCIHTGDEGLIELLSSLTRAMAVAVSSMIAIQQVSSFVTMGPSVFIMMHQQQLLKSIALVGNIQNPQILDSLRDDVNPFNQVLIPDEYVPNITIS